MALLYYVKLCASFQIHRWIQTRVTVRKCSIRVEIGDILPNITLKFDGRPRKTIGHLFNTASCFVHYYCKSIGEVKLELQSGNAQFGSKMFCPAWPWNLMDDLENNRTSLLFYRFVLYLKVIGKLKLEVTVRKHSIRVKIGNFFPCDLEIWQMTLKKQKSNSPMLFHALCIIL